MKRTFVSLVVVACILCLQAKLDTAANDERRHHEKGHNKDIDHEAFLGKDHAHDYDDMEPEESKSKLAAILPRVDINGDGDITKDELVSWIKLQVLDYITRDTQKALPKDDTNKDGKVTWEEYVVNTYGENYRDPDTLPKDHDDDESYTAYAKRDLKRFKLADKDNDGNLVFDEFIAFLHPEEFPHMNELVVEETLEDMDEDKDGKISMEEFLGDVDEDDEDDDDNWYKQEKDKFVKDLDKDKDGFLDVKELSGWVIPMEDEYNEQEANHLISSADQNGDGILSYDEVVDNYDVFIGSQATDYGRLLHDELQFHTGSVFLTKVMIT